MLDINFSQNGEGKVFTSSIKNSLILEECKNKEIKVGEHGTKIDCGETLVRLTFYKVESIDILIKHLLNIRDNIENIEQLTLGC